MPIDLIAEIWGLSICSWGLYCLYCIFSIKFIVKRYEQETDLLNTVFFQEHFTFTRYLIKFHSSGFYALHLLMCTWTWAWRFYGKRKIFRDIEDPKVVTRHFSVNEIRRAKRMMIVMWIVALHGVAYYIFRAVWPDVFSR